MSVKQFVLLLSVVCLSTAAYAQKGVGKAVETAVQRQMVNRAKLPTFRDGMRNLVTRRLGRGEVPALAVVVAHPTHSVLHFGTSLQAQQARVVELPSIVGGRYDERNYDFYGVSKPGSGNIAAIALPAHALIKQAAIAQSSTLEERKVFLQMAESLDQGFAMSKEGDWRLTRGYTFDQFHRLIGHFKEQWMMYSKAYGGSGEPMTQGIDTALDVLDIQTWMLTHGGRLPQTQATGMEATVAWKLNALMDKVANVPAFAQDPAVQGAMKHLVHLRASAKGAMTPFETIYAVLNHLNNGGRIPGSSLAGVDATEDKLTQELNYVEQLRRANLLYILVPMEQSQSLVALYLKDFQEQGHIYQQMIKIIPEFAPDGKTLNVPTHSHNYWKVQLSEWKAGHKVDGLSRNPRSAIGGHLGLPLNFNDLAAEEQTEVLLGTYLRIKDK